MRDGDKEKIEGLLTQLSDAEAEISLLRRRIQNLEDEVNRMKKENIRLQSELQKARTVKNRLRTKMAFNRPINLITFCFRIWTKKRSIASIIKIKFKLCWKKLISYDVFTIKWEYVVKQYSTLKSVTIFNRFRKLKNCKLWLLAIPQLKIVNISKMNWPWQFAISVTNTIPSPLKIKPTWNLGINSRLAKAFLALRWPFRNHFIRV